jgi:hypothetical protein
MFHPRPLKRRNKRILKNKRTITTAMTMKTRGATNHSPFHPRTIGGFA